MHPARSPPESGAGTMEPSAPPTPRSTPPVSDVWLSIVMVVVFVLIGGVFAGAEIALVSLRESQVRAIAETAAGGARRSQRLLSDPNRFLAAVQVGVTFAGFFSAAFGAARWPTPLAGWLGDAGRHRGPRRHARPGPRDLGRSATCRWSSASWRPSGWRCSAPRASRCSSRPAARPRSPSCRARSSGCCRKSTDVARAAARRRPERAAARRSAEEELRDLVARARVAEQDERRLIDEVFRGRRARGPRGHDAAHRGRLPRRRR